MKYYDKIVWIFRGGATLMKRVIKTILISIFICILLQAGAFAEYSTLKKGSSGTQVAKMQSALRALDYDVTVDGLYGTGTEKAVKSFQLSHGLTVDGIAGNKTLTKLYDLVEKRTPAPTPQKTATPVPSDGKEAFIKTSGGRLNMREQPSSSANVKATLANGTAVTVYSVSGSWAYIKAGSQYGYVYASYLSYPSKTATPTATRVITPAPTATPSPVYTTAKVKTSGGALNIRSGPSSSYSTKGSVPNGQTVTVKGTSGSWTLIEYRGTTGYVSSSYLEYSSVTATPVKTTTPSPRPTATPAPSKYATVKTGGASLTMRSGPGTGYSSVTSIPNGKTVTVLSVSGSWTRVSWNGKTGYVSSSYLIPADAPVTETPTVRPTATAAPSGQTARVKTTGGTLNMRSGASTSAPVVLKLPNNAVVQVITKGSWCRVIYNGTTGYVSSSYLVFDPVTTATPVPTFSPVPTATPSPTTGPAISAIGTAVINTTGTSLNLRKSASESAEILAYIPKGTTVYVYSYSQSWCYIRYNDHYGYGMTKYLIYTPFDIPVTPTAKPTATPLPYDITVFTRTLRSGCTGNDVNELQKRLNTLNYLAASCITGTYDTKTVEAVKTFQKLNTLTVDGAAGTATFTALFSPTAVPYSSDITTYNTLHIYYRNESSQDTAAIKKMQNALKALGYTVNVNGSFDETTYLAVLNFQLRNSLTVSGAVSPAMQALLYSGNAKDASTAPSVTVNPGEGMIAGPTREELQLLHWFNTVKPALASSAKLLIFDPLTRLSWTLQVYSKGNHCDSQPLTLKDTLIMNTAFGKPSWTVHTVYVQLPDGRWTMATMHNRPHLTGTITANGFDGHLCVHFLRDMDEVTKNDPDYGLTNQTTLRKSWESLTGEHVN